MRLLVWLLNRLHGLVRSDTSNLDAWLTQHGMPKATLIRKGGRRR